ncbi:MAG: hypothetical protein IT438_00390 [Phycisphaerales bacterium]|nr:hypothetical protein [Phycisphaerales bacterium]
MRAQSRGVGTGCERSGLCLLADFNNSGLISIQDLFDYLAARFAGDFRPDSNRSGAVSVQDLFDYLAAYFGQR